MLNRPSSLSWAAGEANQNGRLGCFVAVLLATTAVECRGVITASFSCCNRSVRDVRLVARRMRCQRIPGGLMVIHDGVHRAFSRGRGGESE